MITLSVVEGRQSGQRFQRDEEVVSLGRGASNSIQIDDELVSRQHGQIALRDAQYVYQDLQSRNGSVIARGDRSWKLDPALPELKVQHGDRIILGHTVLEVSFAPPESTILASRQIPDLDEIESSLRRDHETLLAIYEMERRIHLECDPAQMRQRVLEAVLKAFPQASSVSIAGIEPESLQVAEVSALAAPGKKPALVSRSMAQRALRERKAVCFDEAQVEFARAESVASSGVQCAMCAPLWAGDEPRGVIQVVSTAAAGCFAVQDLDLLIVFANRAAMALAAASLNEERRRTAQFQELTDYLANELRNAATGLVEWLEPLEAGALGELDGLQLEAVQTARQAAAMVGLMVTSMTDLAALREPGLVLELKPVPLDAAIDLPFRLAGAIARSQGVEALSRACASEVLVVLADAALLQRVILNLLSFALAWTEPPQGVCLATGREDGVAVLSVQWSGLAIPEEHQEAIFDPDTQARLWKDLGRRSVGIGLAFCKLAVERMGGRIALDTATSLKVALPLAPQL
jgi:signal transduction histidine kinase